MAARLARMAAATARRSLRKPRIRVFEVLFRNVLRNAAIRHVLRIVQGAGGSTYLSARERAVHSRRCIAGKPNTFPFPSVESFSKTRKQFFDAENVNVYLQ